MINVFQLLLNKKSSLFKISDHGSMFENIQLYISHDRSDILWDIGLLSGRLSAPYDIDMKRLVRVAIYLKGDRVLEFGSRETRRSREA